MVHSCKNICEQYKPKPGWLKTSGNRYKSRYASGQKRCSTCDVYIQAEDMTFCPCCKLRLHGVPTRSKYKNMFRAAMSKLKPKLPEVVSTNGT